ncbi:hypothetical protein H8B02_18595 [Bradyrhizobium sp. Pear77]|uniref:hypothetical protein n=1 Tax=Bradyrhizobium altum TaxID=1571202 RepID=UPI001E5DEB59|nr:hypothetical protein [Bradyrhizobium altum]MCC8955371.1 hypothetical protein [Bradyrhizobium altum]
MKRRHVFAVTSALAAIGCVVVFAAALLAGSSEKEQLEACSTDSEPTLLLRQLNLDGGTKARFSECVAANGKSACQTEYLDRRGLMEACMKRNGFVFASPLKLNCLFEPGETCFRRKWLEGVHSAVASN